MRYYEPIWREIKLHKKAQITANIELHRRIIQAVRKERSKDLGWKLEVSENNGRYALDVKVQGKLITFTLIDKSL